MSIIKYPAPAGGSAPTPATPTTLGTVYGSTDNSGLSAFGYGSENIAHPNFGMPYYGTAIGSFAINRGGSGISIGTNSQTWRDGGIAIGTNVISDGINAIGIKGNAENTGAIAILGNASGQYSISIGSNSADYGLNNCTSVGWGAQSSGTNSSAFGSGSYAASDNNTAIGASAETNGSNSTALGYQAINNVSNSITLGNSSISSLKCAVQTISSLSDERDKTNIEPLNVGLDFINTLNPVKFEWNMRDGAKVGAKDFGFIAQELAAAEDAVELQETLGLTDRNDPEKLLASYGKLVPILVQAVKELSTELNQLKEKVNG